MLAGALTGLLQLIVTTPMELLKIQMQNAGRLVTLTKEGNLLFKLCLCIK